MCICCRASNGFLVIARIQGSNGNFSLSCSSEMLSSNSHSQAWVDRDKRMKLSGFRVLRLECIPLVLHGVKWRMWEVCNSFTWKHFPAGSPLVVLPDVTWTFQVELHSGVPKFVPGLHVTRRPTFLYPVHWCMSSQKHRLLGIRRTHFPEHENKDKTESKGLGGESWSLF